MDSVYLISSDSIRLIDEEIAKIVKDNVYETFDLNFVSIDEILEEANYFSLFDEKKYIVVKNANIFVSKKKKDDEEDDVSKKDESLVKYLESPNYNTVLIFTLNGKAAANKKITKLIKEKYNYIEVGNLKTRDVYDKVEKLLKDKGYKASKDIIYYIINNSLNNYDLAYNEVQKIDLYYKKGCVLKLEDVTHIVSKVMEDNNFKFIDALMTRNIKEVFNIYDDLMIQKVEPNMLMAMIGKEIRYTLLIKQLLATENKDSIMKKLDIKYSFQLDKYINNSYNFTEKKLEDSLIKLCDYDYKFKNGKISNKLALQLFLLDFCK
jgi:DNA polymerase-3 subunit delta